MSDRSNIARVTGLVLSGGGARGFAHIGVLKVLEREGFRPDLVAGTSMGAIIGALYAAGHSPDTIHEFSRSLRWIDLIDPNTFGPGLLKGDKLGKALAEVLPETFEELGLPLAVTTTDIESGQQVILREGDLVTAVRASSCFPGAFEPIEHQGRMLFDGGVVNNLPVEAAAFMGATWTIASNVTEPRRISYYTGPRDDGNWLQRLRATVMLERRSELVQLLMRSNDIMMAILTDQQYALHPANIHIRIPQPDIRVESFSEVEQSIALGEAAAAAALASYAAEHGAASIAVH